MKKKIIFLSLILGIIIISFLYTGLWDPFWNPFRPPPQVILAKMALRMKSAKSFSMKGIIQIMENQKGKHFKWYKEKQEEEFYSKESGDIILSIDVLQKEKKKRDFSFSFKGEIHQENNIWKEKPFFADISSEKKILRIGNDFYFFKDSSTESSLPSLTNFPHILPKKKWIRFNQDQLGDFLTLYIPEILEEDRPFVKIQISKEKQQELIEIILKNIISTPFYEVEKELPDEKIEDKTAYHYLVKLDKQKIKKLISNISLEVAENLDDCISPINSSKEEFYSSSLWTIFAARWIEVLIEEIYGKLGDIKIEMWIGKKDNFLYRIRFEKEKDILDFLRKETPARELSEANISVLVDIKFSKFNETLNINSPSKYINLEEVIGKFLSPQKSKKND